MFLLNYHLHQPQQPPMLQKLHIETLLRKSLISEDQG